MHPILSGLAGRLIVSCQAYPGDPLLDPDISAKMAVSVVRGGAAAVRVREIGDIRAVRAAVDVPIIGLVKIGFDGVYITPRVSDAVAVLDAGADIVAIDATSRPRPDRRSFAQVLDELRSQRDCVVMADVATVDEGVAAAAAGADLVGTTLAGYTDARAATRGPDLALIAELVTATPVPVIGEGRISTPEQALAALAAGAHAVVVGRAITHPQTITTAFVDGLRAPC